MTRSSPIRQILEVCHRLAERGFVVATDGNVSMRLPEGNILVTRSGVPKGEAGSADLLVVDLKGRRLRGSGIPSTELGMHLFIYRRRSDVGAVVHAHPPYATGFAVARIPLDHPVLPEVILGLGPVPLARYATPSTPEMARSLEPYVRTACAVLLANHGVVTWGASLRQASLRMEKVEHAAQICFVASQLGGAKTLGPRALKNLRQAFRS